MGRGGVTGDDEVGEEAGDEGGESGDKEGEAEAVGEDGVGSTILGLGAGAGTQAHEEVCQET